MTHGDDFYYRAKPAPTLVRRQQLSLEEDGVASRYERHMHLRDGTLPVSSNVPAFAEVMGAVGLSDWTFPEGNSDALRADMRRLARMDDGERRERLESARAALVNCFAWDDYWPRVTAVIEDLRRCA